MHGRASVNSCSAPHCAGSYWTQLYTTVSAPTTSTNLRGALLLLTSAQRLQLFQLYGVSFQAVPIVVLLFQLSSTHSLLNFSLRSVLCRSICLPCTAHFVYISFRSLSPRVSIQQVCRSCRIYHWRKFSMSRQYDFLVCQYTSACVGLFISFSTRTAQMQWHSRAALRLV